MLTMLKDLPTSFPRVSGDEPPYVMLDPAQP